MLNSAAFQSLLLAAVYLSSRAVPLRSSAPSSDRQWQRAPAGPEDHHEERAAIEEEDGRLSEVNVIIRTSLPSLDSENTRAFLFQLSSSTHNPDPLTSEVSSERSHTSAPVEEAAVFSSSVHEGLGRNEDGALGLDDGAVWTYASYQTQSADGQQRTQTSASLLDHLVVSVNDSSPVNVQTADPFIRENAESSERPSETKTTDFIQPGHLRERATEDQTLAALSRRLEADANTGRPSVLTSFGDPTSLTVSGGSSEHLLTGVSRLGFRSADAADVWTEPDHLQREEVSVEPSSQDLLTDVTMSSEDLPLIFEPFDDVTPTENSALMSELPVAMAPTAVTAEDAELMVSMETDHASSAVSLSGMLDWPSSWQTSGTEKTNTITSSQMQIKRPDAESRQPKDHYGKTQNDDVTQMTTDALQLPTSEAKTDTEDLESKEEPDEDEDDEGLDSEEEDSEEDLTESTTAPASRPPHSLVPPPPVWMQGKQGLVRSWVELIREKAGYVSGMLAPVGIGIAGALLLVGALYSIREIHRRRRDNLKNQRNRPVREVQSGPDNAMLLADSSEDEF